MMWPFRKQSIKQELEILQQQQEERIKVLQLCEVKCRLLRKIISRHQQRIDKLSKKAKG